MYQVILFDLDGTLTDSAEGITKSIQYAMEKMGYSIPEELELTHFVGPPLKEEFMKTLHMTEEEANKTVELYRERYHLVGMFENRPYEGIIELLEKLKKKGHILGVASSKPEHFVKQILEFFHMDKYFDVIVGSQTDGTRTGKAEVVEEAVCRLGYEQRRESIILVGDRKYDILGARQKGIDCIAVSYGYGDYGELSPLEPVAIASTVEELTYALDFLGTRKDSTGLKVWRCIYPLLIHRGMMEGIAAIMMIVLMIAGVSITPSNVGDLSLWATALGGAMFVPLGMYFVTKDKSRGTRIPRDEKSLGLGKALWLMAFGASLSYILNIVLSLLRIFEIFPEYNELSEQIFQGQPFWILCLCVGIAAPIAEEYVFRGLLFQRLRDYMNLSWAIVISAVIFGVYHGNMVQFIYATLLGLVMAWLMARYENLAASIWIHIGANVWSVLLTSYGASWGKIGGGAILGLVLLAQIGITVSSFIWLFNQREDRYRLQ